MAEAHQRIHCVIYAYCLMGNHYHSLLETPNANLSRIMRHINGVHTQRHNRPKSTDGALFWGRYKTILADKDACLLQLGGDLQALFEAYKARYGRYTEVVLGIRSTAPRATGVI